MKRLFRDRVWLPLVRLVGGFYDIGPFCLLLHDDGVLVSRDDIVRWEWRLRPPVIHRGVVMRVAAREARP